MYRKVAVSMVENAVVNGRRVFFIATDKPMVRKDGRRCYPTGVSIESVGNALYDLRFDIFQLTGEIVDLTL